MTASILLVVTHLLGAGHLSRTAAIARAVARRGDRATLVSGGRPLPLIDLGRIDLVQLPPVAATPDDLATLRTPDGEPVTPGYLARRREELLRTLRSVRPDVVVTELYPFGRRALAAEFDALIAAAGTLRPRPALVCSVRDILVAPEQASKVERTHDLLARHYDAILVHADPGLVRLDASWPIAAALGERIAYTGFVDAEEDDARPDETIPGREVVVSGGSSAASLPLYAAALAAADRLPDLPFRVLVGHGVGEPDMTILAGRAGPNVLLERARPDFRDLLRNAALLVGQSGYNTVMDILATGVRVVLVPFERGRETEQRSRADRLAALGIATVLPEERLGGDTLAAAIAAKLADPGRSGARFDLTGAARTAAILAEWTPRRREEDRHACARIPA